MVNFAAIICVTYVCTHTHKLHTKFDAIHVYGAFAQNET